MYNDPCKRVVNAQGKYSSGKDMLKKSFEMAKQMEEIEKNMKELLPVMSKLFEIRLQNRTPLKVMRPINYETCEMVKSEKNEGYVNTWKTIHTGDELLLKSFDHNCHLFIFTNRAGEELEIAYTDYQKLLTNSDIYEVCSSIYKK